MLPEGVSSTPSVPPPPQQDGHGHGHGEDQPGGQAGLGQPLSVLVPPSLGLPLAEFGQAASQLPPGAPPRLASTAPHPSPGRGWVTWSQAHASVPHARGTGLLSPGISEAHIHSHVYIIQNPDLPCLASDITGPHPELSLGSVPPTGQPAVPPTPGPWLPQQ